VGAALTVYIGSTDEVRIVPAIQGAVPEKLETGRAGATVLRDSQVRS
jgi:hypothetical protein